MVNVTIYIYNISIRRHVKEYREICRKSTCFSNNTIVFSVLHKNKKIDGQSKTLLSCYFDPYFRDKADNIELAEIARNLQ